MSLFTCLNGCDLRGEPIPARHFAPELHEEPYHSDAVARFGSCCCLPYGDKPEADRFFSRLIGVEDGTYDGISWWLCPDCGVKWNRWTGVVADA